MQGLVLYAPPRATCPEQRRGESRGPPRASLRDSRFVVFALLTACAASRPQRSPGQLAQESFIKNNYASIVFIEALVSGRKNLGYIPRGTGVIIDENGLVLTAAHVIENALNIRAARPKITFTEGGSVTRIEINRRFELKTVKVSPLKDSALLQFTAPPRDLRVMLPDRDWHPRLDEPVWLFGRTSFCALGQITNARTGVGLRKGGGYFLHKEVIQAQITALKGDSGGPLVNEGGKLVGIVVIAQNMRHGKAYFIPIDDALRAVNFDETVKAMKNNENK